MGGDATNRDVKATYSLAGGLEAPFGSERGLEDEAASRVISRVDSWLPASSSELITKTGVTDSGVAPAADNASTANNPCTSPAFMSYEPGPQNVPSSSERAGIVRRVPTGQTVSENELMRSMSEAVCGHGDQHSAALLAFPNPGLEAALRQRFPKQRHHSSKGFAIP